MVDASFTWTSRNDIRDRAKMLAKLQKNVGDELEEAAEEISLRLAADAQRNAPVDTGRLRSSIEQDVERITEHAVKAIVGSNVVYAPVQEVQQPYLRPAVRQNEDTIKEIVSKALERAVKDAS